MRSEKVQMMWGKAYTTPGLKDLFAEWKTNLSNAREAEREK
jgi:hypothetical protein